MLPTLSTRIARGSAPAHPEQRQAALEKAAASRRERAEVKNRLKNSGASIVDVLSEGQRNEVIGKMRVVDLLQSMPGLGKVRARQLMESSGSPRAAGSAVWAPNRSRRSRRSSPRVTERSPARHERESARWWSSSDRDRGTRSRRACRAPQRTTPVSDHPSADPASSSWPPDRGRRTHRRGAPLPPRGLDLGVGRPDPTPGSRNKVHYWFVSDEEFDRMVEHGELLEWAVVHKAARVRGRLTAGRPRARVRAAGDARDRPAGAPARSARRCPRRCSSSLPPSWEELVRRLVGRGTESEEERVRRLETAREELAAEGEFDETIVNHEVHDAAEQLVALMAPSPTDL